MMRAPRAVFAALLTLGLAGAVLAPAAAAAPEPLDLAALDRGAPPAVPYLERHVLVDGSLRIPLPSEVVAIIGQVDGDYLVWAFTRGTAAREKILRISPDGSRTLVLQGRMLYDTRVSPDGSALATAVIGNNRVTTLRVYDVETGALTKSRTLPGNGSVLDFDGDRVAIGIDNPDKTVTWTLATDTIAKVSGGVGYSVDLASDRFARFSKDPFRGGCTVVSTLSDPDTELWTSCRERVEAWSTDGSRMATVGLLADGLGPGRLWLRKTGGRLLGAYDSPYYFGAIGFEDETHVLMDTYSTSKYAVLRCDRNDCERASRTYPDSTPALAAREPAARVP